MRQIWITKAGKPENLEIREAPAPTPRNGEIRIRVQAVGVNFADIMGRIGLYNDAPDIPYVPGYEVAGVVDMVSQGVTDLREGDEVFALTQFGGYSDIVCVPHRQVFKRLDWLPANEAAALPVNYLTAYMALLVMGSLRPGSRVLIHNVGGGVGLAALDICKIIGAETFGTASPGKHDFLRERGLHHAIDYRNVDYERAIAELTGEKGVHLVLDPLGGRHWMKNYRLLMPSGRVIHYGISSAVSGKKRSLLAAARAMIMLPFYSPLRLMSENKGVAGINLAHLWNHIDICQDWMKEIIRWYDEALFRPHVDKIFKFDQAAEAHHYLQDRKNIGKVLLIP